MRLAALAVLAIFWLIPEDASAQWGRGRGRSGYNPRGGYYGNQYGGNYGNNWGWRGGYYGSRYYNYPRLYSYPYGYGYSYSIPGNTYYSSPNVIYNSYDSSPRTSMYFDTDLDTFTNRQARVQVRLANPDDELIVQNVPIPGSGRVRDFVSPDLDSGKEYVYTIEVRRPGSTSSMADQIRKVSVKTGGSYTVDFTTRDSSVTLPR